MKQILAYLMALVMGLMVACLLMRAVDEFFTLAWVGFYLVLAFIIVVVLEDNGGVYRGMVHGEPVNRLTDPYYRDTFMGGMPPTEVFDLGATLDAWVKDPSAPIPSNPYIRKLED